MHQWEFSDCTLSTPADEEALFEEKGFYVNSGEGNTTDHFEVCSEISTMARSDSR